MDVATLSAWIGGKVVMNGGCCYLVSVRNARSFVQIAHFPTPRRWHWFAAASRSS